MVIPLLFSGLSACAYKIDIQQGNTIEPEKLEQLKIGMNKQQVQFLMGSPMLIDAFHPQRWEYVYSFKKGGAKMTRRRVTLTFDSGILSKIDKSQYKEVVLN